MKEFKVWCRGTSDNLNFNKPCWWNLGSYMLNKYYDIPSILAGNIDEDFNRNFDLVQFTGFYDKNEVKIFEGDIIKITQHYYDCEDVDTYNTEVIFYENHSCFGYTSKEGHFNMLIGQGLEIEVIGNKFENK